LNTVIESRQQSVSAAGESPGLAFAKSYRRDIDGLRAIAVTSVVAYHAGLSLFSGGFVGVDVFFVISGYLIGSHVYKEMRHSRFGIASFYQKRAKRILPALFAVLLFCYIVSIFLLDGMELKTLAEYIVATVASASNILIWLKVNYFSPGANQNPLLMTWSLGVEEQFYLIFPLIMLFFVRMGRRRLFIATLLLVFASLTLSVLGIFKYRTATFYLLPTRAWELAVGILLAIYEVDRPPKHLYVGGRFANLLGLFGIAMLLYAILRYDANTPFPGLAATLPVIGTALILASPSGWLNRNLLSFQPIVFVGLVSYSWYLWHWPLLSFARIVADRDISTATASGIAVLSFGVACFSYRFIERPFRKSKTDARPLLLRYGIACVVMLIPAVVLIALKGWPSRFPSLAAVEAHSGLQQNDTCLVQYGAAAPNFSTYCVPQQDQRDGIALLGDSHAGALAEALRELARSENLKLYELTKSSCPPLSGVTRYMPNHPGHERECASFNQEAIAFVRRDPRIKTVWLAGYWSAPFVEELQGSRYVRTGQSSPVSAADSSAYFGSGLAATVAALQSSGKQVVILKDNPQFDFDPVRRVRANFVPLRGELTKVLTSDERGSNAAPRHQVSDGRDAMVSSVIDRMTGLSTQVFDLNSNLCDKEFCYFYKGDLLLYTDPQHLSLAGARRALSGLQLSSVPVGSLRDSLSIIRAHNGVGTFRPGLRQESRSGTDFSDAAAKRKSVESESKPVNAEQEIAKIPGA
jgi:peptidoglycan/LPS O-acetylase OafA/YrhL